MNRAEQLYHLIIMNTSNLNLLPIEKILMKDEISRIGKEQSRSQKLAKKMNRMLFRIHRML